MTSSPSITNDRKLSLVTRFILDNPRLVDHILGILRPCPPVLGFIRRSIFYSARNESFPFSILLSDPIAERQNCANERTIFVDVSATTRHDQGTGMYRVTRELLRHWWLKPPAGWRIMPIYSDGTKFYSFLRSGRPGGKRDIFGNFHEEISPTSSDILVLLDTDVYLINEMEKPIENIRRGGTKIYALVHDLIPLINPNYSPELFSKNFRLWLDVLLRQADGIVTVASATSEEIRGWAVSYPPHRTTPLRIGFSHNGTDIKAKDGDGSLEDPVKINQILRGKPSILMVSTLEPRKGYAQALLAFESLWACGVDVNLVIVGRKGWKIDALAERIASHPENGRRLFWFQQANDSFLSLLYKKCSVLLAASECEGFGLPLIEAAQFCLPVIARDIPVFREVAGDHAFYFSGLTGEDLAGALHEWLSLWERNLAPSSLGLNWITWEQSAANFMRLLLEQDAPGWRQDWVPEQP